ncbi:hypothetical protein B0H19DRAFT_1213005 [Mycena capillaripes]|nr:hypothetical protein B0H19DRAFT_1213005 [Mycena capillaripes]
MWVVWQSRMAEHLIPNYSGFVRTVITAYNHNHALLIHADDIWLAILCQFNFFVNADAEVLCTNFVAHEGKHELSASSMMVELFDKSVTDPTLRSWALPTFTKTTTNDRTVAAYGIETIAWYHLLHSVIARFAAAFDAPNSTENVELWGQINAFNVLSRIGEWLGHALDTDVSDSWFNWKQTRASTKPPESLSTEKFWKKSLQAGMRQDQDLLLFDGTPYHHVDSKKVPPGFAEADVTLNDNDNIFSVNMIAGMVGTRVSSSGDAALSADGRNDTVSPVAGWRMFTNEE